MKRIMLMIILILVAGGGLFAWMKKTVVMELPQNAAKAVLPASPRVLVACFSHSGNTMIIARKIQKKTGGAFLEIVPDAPYPQEYKAVVEQAGKELKEGYRPPLKSALPDANSFDVLLVGSPVWWGTIAPPVSSFLSGLDLKGKVVIPFCTHNGGGPSKVFAGAAALCPKSAFLEGYAAFGKTADYFEGDLDAWLAGIGLVK